MKRQQVPETAQERLVSLFRQNRAVTNYEDLGVAYPCKLGAVAMLAVYLDTDARRNAVRIRLRALEPPTKPRFVHLHMTRTPAGIEVETGDPTKDTEVILTGQYALPCTFLTWNTFPKGLAVSVTDSGNVFTNHSVDTVPTHYIYRIRHGTNEILLVRKAEEDASRFVNALLGVEYKSVVVKRAAIAADEDVTWSSHWCIDGCTSGRAISTQLRELAGFPDVLSDVIAAYCEFGQYETIGEYWLRKYGALGRDQSITKLTR